MPGSRLRRLLDQGAAATLQLYKKGRADQPPKCAPSPASAVTTKHQLMMACCSCAHALGNYNAGHAVHMHSTSAGACLTGEGRSASQMCAFSSRVRLSPRTRCVLFRCMPLAAFRACTNLTQVDICTEHYCVDFELMSRSSGACCSGACRLQSLHSTPRSPLRLMSLRFSVWHHVRAVQVRAAGCLQGLHSTPCLTVHHAQ